jgi:KDO2-lipid IV(A) lauroyltransferase
MRRTATENMRQVLGSDTDVRQLRKCVRSAYRNYFKYLAEFLMLPSISRQRLQQSIDHAGWENLDCALADGKGAIFVCFHIGNWDIAGSMIAVQGYPMNVVVDAFNPKRLNDVIQGYRIEKGVKIIPVEQAARKVLQVLRHNEILGLLVDLPAPDGVPVQLFGATCRIPAGAATLALRTGAKVLPGYLIRKPDNSFEGRIGTPIDFQASGDMETDVQQFSQAIVDRLSCYVRDHPEQWFVARQLWVRDTSVNDNSNVWAAG